jgi:hypothetical protein
MERIDLTKTIKEATATFCQNRIGDKPPISVTVPTIKTDIPWPDRKLQELVKLFLYETLLTNDPDAEVTVSLRRRSQLKDLSEFVGVQPTYWLHLRISGRGVRLSEFFIDEFFSDIGYTCAEWVGVAESETRLGIFTAAGKPEIKIVFCLDDGHFKRKFDLLLPVREPVALSPDINVKHRTPAFNRNVAVLRYRVNLQVASSH